MRRYPENKGQCKADRSYSPISSLRWLLWINIVVYMIMCLIQVVSTISGETTLIVTVRSLLALPGELQQLTLRPWTVVTYMFVQIDLFHLFFNILWLYWFGVLFLEFHRSVELVMLYLTGGITGAVAFVMAVFLIPGINHTAFLVGASASVLAIVVATAILEPEREVGLMIFSDVKIKWIAFLMIVMDMINVGLDNTGGHIAHLGGATAGVAVALIIKKKYMWRERKTDVLIGQSDGEQIHTLLDKVRHSGYKSLTVQEQQQLFDLSQKIGCKRIK